MNQYSLIIIIFEPFDQCILIQSTWKRQFFFLHRTKKQRWWSTLEVTIALFLRPNKWRPRSSVWLDPSNLGSLGVAWGPLGFLGVAWVRGDHMGTYLLAGEHYWHCLRHFLDDDLDGSEKWGSATRSTMINEYPWYGCYRWLYMVILIYIYTTIYILLYYIYTHLNILMILDDAFSTSYD